MGELKPAVLSALVAVVSTLSALACDLIEFHNSIQFGRLCSISNSVQTFLWLLSVLFSLVSLLGFAFIWNRNPFKYPYLVISFDVSRRKQPILENELEDWLCDKQNWMTIKGHLATVKLWKEECGGAIGSSWCPNHRFKQYLETIDDGGMYLVSLERNRTGYRQRNYVRSSYTYTVTEDSEHFSFEACQRFTTDSGRRDTNAIYTAGALKNNESS